MAITGRTALLTLAGAVPVALAPGWAMLLGWVGVVIALVGIDLALAGRLTTVTVTREPLRSVRLGEPTSSAVLVTNTGPRAVRGVVRDAWQPSAGAHPTRQQLVVPAGERRRVVTQLRPVRRGDRLATGLTVRSVGPLGLGARQRTLAASGRLRVLPPFTSRKHLPSKLARLRELDGRTSLQVRGQGTEFDSLRDYVIGDDVRAIDWRATARRQQVVVRTWRPERDRRVLIVLDTSRTSAARIGDEPRLDASMDAALLLAALAARAGDRVDLLAVDRRVRARVEGASRTELLPAMVEAMAPLEADLVEADWTTIVATVRARLSHRALVVLLTSLDSAAVDQGLLPVLAQLTSHHLVVLASVSDPALAEMAAGREDAHAVYGAAAATRTLLDQDGLAAELRRFGVEVVTGTPDHLPPRLADRYLNLKATGRL
ncbi:MAG: DUF58 domain-containing protein [Kineosporiaceae bacterium]|nr:DUF58 domain-containing protein [Kineosporiaceae bacterium]MBK7621403.1 DUF58 domain-containing protein [Kineosporiaceae bacterium]MBK8077440.1 DUF58 domain-containing protein [Kineosporiaceae bacterium]